MADNFNINTTQDQANEAAGVLPGGQNFGTAIAANNLQTANMQELVKQAQERTKQAQIGTAESQKIFDTQAYLSEKGLMPKAQALAELKLVLSRQGADDDEITKDMAIAQDQFPEELDGQAIWRFYSALKEPKAPAAISAGGSAFQATGKEKDVNGDPFTEGTWIQEKADSEGNQVFVHSSEPAAEVKADTKGGAGSEKEWQKLGTAIDSMLKTRFGATGMLATTIFRADRAINTLARGPESLTSQDLSNVSTDIAAIYQGGVPSIVQTAENSYGTSLTTLLNTIRKYTGAIFHFGSSQLEDSVTKLRQVLTDMRNSAVVQLKSAIESEAPAYKELINSDPQRWQELVHAKIDFLTSGTMNKTGDIQSPTGAPAVAAPGAAPIAPQGQNDPLGIR